MRRPVSKSACLGPSSIQIRDLRQLPIAEIGIHQFSLVAVQTGLISQAHSTLKISAYSYNALCKDWEPILLPTELLLNYGHNLSAFVWILSLMFDLSVFCRRKKGQLPGDM